MNRRIVIALGLGGLWEDSGIDGIYPKALHRVVNGELTAEQPAKQGLLAMSMTGSTLG